MAGMSSHSVRSASGREQDLVGPLGDVGVFTWGIRRTPHLAPLIGASSLVYQPWLSGRHVDTVVGWGRKPNTRLPRAFAGRHGCPFVALEDGFLRSVGLGVDGAAPLSIVVDDIGIHYDATRPSRLERILEGRDGASHRVDSPELRDRAVRCMEQIRRHRLSKFNAAPHMDLGSRNRPRVLVIDQTAGDLSVRLGRPHPGGFDAMLGAALDEHPRAEILVKTHPNVSAGKKRGHLERATRDPRVRLLSASANPISLLEQVDHVYVMTSLMGFEALLLGKPVSCFGVPFYAGWGLTDDRVEVPRRSRRRSLAEVFAAAYLLYARYLDPDTGERCEIERVIEHLALQRSMVDANSGSIVCVGFSAWKKGFVPSFLKAPGNRIAFASDAAQAEGRLSGGDDKLLVWGSREPEDLRDLAVRRGLPLWRMEDGFLRSVGLGSDLVAPASLVVDRLGIYYDPSRPSELEQILEAGGFDDDELARASALRQRIVASGISKYNVGARAQATAGPKPGGATVALVIGQVEDDASIQLGCPGIRRNEELIRTVREQRPEAWVVFKPHPDVVSGNREGGVLRERALEHCDEVVEDIALSDCLAAADEVHTLTSLVGFEALLRGLPVTVYGQPFYAGWGLTEDLHPHARRKRRLTLDELVAGTLIRYPRYVSLRTGSFTTPEVIVDQLQEARARRGQGTVVRSSWAGRKARKLLNLARGLRHAP